MSCGHCKKQYRITLTLSEQQRTDTFGNQLKETFSRIFKWNHARINSTIDISIETGSCQLFDVGKDEMIRLSKKLTQNNIPYSVKNL